MKAALQEICNRKKLNIKTFSYTMDVTIFITTNAVGRYSIFIGQLYSQCRLTTRT